MVVAITETRSAHSARPHHHSPEHIHKESAGDTAMLTEIEKGTGQRLFQIRILVRWFVVLLHYCVFSTMLTNPNPSP